MFTITKGFDFEATHKLKLPYDSPCTNFHGHSYNVKITIKTDSLNSSGMVMDFSKLNDVKDWVMKYWDHAAIIPHDMITGEMRNIFGKIAVFPELNVTAELMCVFLHRKTCEILSIPGKQVTIKIHETRNNCATYTE